MKRILLNIKVCIGQLNKFMKQNNEKSNNVFLSTSGPSFYYKSETWTLTTKGRRRLEREKNSSCEIYGRRSGKELQVFSMKEKLQYYRPNWLGHLDRTEEEESRKKLKYSLLYQVEEV